MSDGGDESVVWTNWAGNQTCRPVTVARPTTAVETASVVAAAASAGRRVKPVGSGHSFSPVALTDGVLVDLSGMCGLAGVERNVARASALGLPPALGESVSLVRVRAGTRLRHLNQMLAEQGLAMPNLGDIDAQTISGALATGTHGTGARFPGLAACVTAVQLVLTNASIVECSRHVRPELFAAARLGIGAIGIVTEVELACVPAFLVRAQERPERLGAVLERLPEWAADTDHVDLYVFPHTDRALVKRNTRLRPGDDGPRLADWRRRLDDDLLSNTVLERVCRIGSRSPARVPALNEVAGRALSARTFVAPSHEVFVTRRDVRFRECEWAVPAASLVPLLTGLREYFGRRDPVVGMPVEVRFGAADDVWLSPGYGRETGYLAVHEHHSAPPSSYFADVEAMVREHEGRPHWGKLHGLGADRLRELYPRFDDFARVRGEADPQRLFGNDYLTRVLGD